MSKPVRLHKGADNSHKCNIDIEAWAMAHANLLLWLVIIMLISLFVLVCWALVGVSATDSGLTYNQLENII